MRLEKREAALLVLTQFIEEILKLNLHAAAERGKVKADQGVTMRGPHLRTHAEGKLVDLKRDLHCGPLRKPRRLVECKQAAFGAQVDDTRAGFRVLAGYLEG